MKKIELEFQENGTTKAIELFNYLLEKSEYNLNQFVKSDGLVISNETPEGVSSSLKEFIEMMPDVIRKIDDRVAFWSIFEKLDDYENNSRFITWVQKYVEAIIRPLEEAAFLNEMDEKSFKKMADYCFEKFILKDIGKKRIDNSIGNVKQMLTLRKIIFTFLGMIVVHNFSKENTYDNMERMFGIKESYCEILWRQYEGNEERIWRIMMMKQYSRIENKLNYLLEMRED